MYGARDSQFPRNDKLNDTLFISAVVVLVIISATTKITDIPCYVLRVALFLSLSKDCVLPKA